MKDGSTYPFEERDNLLRAYHLRDPLPPVLHEATYTLPNGEPLPVEVLGVDEQDELALLSARQVPGGQHVIWLARRDQTGKPGTWLWSSDQLEQARQETATADDRPIMVAPIHPDRRVELLMLGLTLGKTDAEVQAQLRAEGLDETLPENYRTEQGELDLLKHWRPESHQRPRPQGTAQSTPFTPNQQKKRP